MAQLGKVVTIVARTGSHEGGRRDGGMDTHT